MSISPFTSHSQNSFQELDLVSLVEASGKLQKDLHQKADDLRKKIFGDRVFIRAVIEVSNFCRQNCNYCGMRRDNRSLERYRLSLDELLNLVLNCRPDSVTDINIQAGEDPIEIREVIIPFIRGIKKQTNLGVSVCLGMLSEKEYAALKEAGADYYIMKLETGNAEHYRDMQAPGKSLESRVQHIRKLAASGWNVSSGFIYGLPDQSLKHVVESLELLKSLPLAGSSVSPFIAGDQTLYTHYPHGDLEKTLNCVALMRLQSPRRIIPAVSALNIVGSDGYHRALRAGANLTTINMTPSENRQNYLLYKRDRFIMTEERILSSISKAGFEVSKESLSSFLIHWAK